MDHVAIMRKSMGLLPKIINGEKTIESRWSTRRNEPWRKVKTGDKIYFKNSGEKVSAVAEVNYIKIFQSNPKYTWHVLTNRKDTIKKLGVEDLNVFYGSVKDKKWGGLFGLKNVRRVKPFQINKRGFGNMAAWISLDNIKKIAILRT